MTMPRRSTAWLTPACLLLAGGWGAACSPGNPGVDTAGGVGSPYACDGDNDGVIDADELPVVLGGVVEYVANDTDETVTVQVDPTDLDGEPTWDFTDGPTEVYVEFGIVDPGRFWFSSYFPSATYAAPVFTDWPDVFGVFEETGSEVLMLGLASYEEEPEGEQTLLVYDDPVVAWSFPLELGATWTSEGTFRDARLLGVANQGEELYTFEVDAQGTLLLPGYALENTLRVRMEVDQTYAVATGSNTASHIEYLYVRECFGELARITSQLNETDPTFTEATEFRRLATGG